MPPIMPSQPDRSILLDPTKNLIKSMNTNNVRRIKSAINVPCVDLNTRVQSHQQMTVLMRFCYLDISSKSRKDLVNLVLEGSTFCNLNAQDLMGRTVLAHACLQEDDEMIKLLAKEDSVDPNIGDDFGDTALMHACRTDNAAVVKTLLGSFKEYGLDVNATNNEGISPLVEAARLGYVNVIRTLVLDGDVDVDKRDRNRNCAQDYLVVSGKGLTSDFLLLCPTAQRKRLARERRVAEGRKSMMDLVNGSSAKDILPHTSKWLSEDKIPTKSKIVSNKPAQPNTVPLSQEYTGQLNSVVFQMKQCIPMLTESPLEEEMEDVETSKPLRLTRRRRSSSLSELEDAQESFFEKYMVNDLHNDDMMLEKQFSPQRKHSEKQMTLLSTNDKLFDGRMRLQPIQDSNGLGNAGENAPAMVSRRVRQRRSSLPTDIPMFIEKQADHLVRRSSFSRDPAYDQEMGRDRGIRSRSNSLELPASTSNPSSPRPKVAMSKTSDPLYPSTKTGAKAAPSEISRAQATVVRRSSMPSLPQIDTYNNNQSPSISSSSSTRSRRVTHPATSMTSKNSKNSEPISMVYRPRAVESRVTTSWEGKSSKQVPSYLFR